MQETVSLIYEALLLGFDDGISTAPVNSRFRDGVLFALFLFPYGTRSLVVLNVCSSLTLLFC